jgi:hypothetical protein
MSAVWYGWILGIPVATNPWFDATGAYATTGQPYFSAPGGNGQLLFLAGALVNGNTVTRTVSVKQGTALFSELQVVEWDNDGVVPRLGGTVPVAGAAVGVPQLRAVAAAVVDTATGLFCTLTPADANFAPTGGSVSVPFVRLQSSPFAYTLPAGNIYQVYFGLNIMGTVAPAVADGYWIFLPGGSLAAGNYLLHWGGTIVFGGAPFPQDVTYQLTVTP